MTSPNVHRLDVRLRPDSARVIGRLFLPGEEPYSNRSRAAAVVARVLALDEAEIETMAGDLIAEFAPRHEGYVAMLRRHAATVASRVADQPELSEARVLVLGAAFTAEYATEGAALLNPSAVIGPDQSGLTGDQVRVALSYRAIGEGHLSSIGFGTAVIGPGPRWEFEPRGLPVVAARASGAVWDREQLRAVLEDQSRLDEVGSDVLHGLPARVEITDLERVIADLHPNLLARPAARGSLDVIRRTVQSAYVAEFAANVELGRRLLHPVAEEESNGMEDARLTRFVGPDGVTDYRGTYTAYDGHRIAPRLLTSPDLRTFETGRLIGPAARNKGMALFPRQVGGRHLALCRSDGETTSIATSTDGLKWDGAQELHRPSTRFEILQVGNCGPPIETGRGWLVLTHAVAPMRVYTIGVMLLDLEDPRRVLGALPAPLLSPTADDQDGYVPHVVYSCGGVVHDGRLWIPYGIGDDRVAVAWVDVDELLDQLTGPGSASSRS